MKTWSFTRLGDFEKCKYLAKLKYDDKIPEPPKPLPKGKTEHANERGSRIHDGAELYVRGGVELLPELDAFRSRLDELRAAFAEKKIQCEEDWNFNEQWQPVGNGSADTWLRMKLDVLHWISPTHVKVIDYKTGQKFGNEVKHAEQGQLYMLGVLFKYPEVEHVDVEFWYIDQGTEYDLKMSFPRAHGEQFQIKYHKRGVAATTCTDFKPNPNAFSCKWCPYKDYEDICEYGLRDPAMYKRFNKSLAKKR